MKHLLIYMLLLSGTTLFAQNEIPPEATNLYAVMDKINYPNEAKSAGIHGKVMAQITINTKGKVADYQILESPSPLLSAEVEKHLTSLRFKPATKEGKAIKSIVQLPFQFELPPQEPSPKVYTSVKSALANPLKVIELDLSGKKSSSLSADLSKCLNLKVLSLDKMRLEKVPSFIKKLKLLEEISLTDNQLTSIPGWLVKMKNLESLDLRSNDFNENYILDLREKFENCELFTD